jgi:hypothetical protein
LTTTYSHMGSPTLPSAMALFTSEFGMGSGGSTPLWSSSNSAAFVLAVSSDHNLYHLFLPTKTREDMLGSLTILFWNNGNQG